MLVSDTDEESANFAAQDLEIMNTMEATAHFWSSPKKCLKKLCFTTST